MKQIDFYKYFGKLNWELSKPIRNSEIGFNVYKYYWFTNANSFNVRLDLCRPVLENECELVDTTYTHQFLLQTKPQVKIVSW